MKYECNMRRGQGPLLKPIPEGEGAQINAMHTALQTHTQTLDIRHVKECVSLADEQCIQAVKTLVAERKRCSDRESCKQTGRERDSHPLTECYFYANDRQGIKAEENGNGDYSHRCCCGN